MNAPNPIAEAIALLVERGYLVLTPAETDALQSLHNSLGRQVQEARARTLRSRQVATLQAEAPGMGTPTALRLVTPEVGR
jgi:hypothetical protein